MRFIRFKKNGTASFGALVDQKIFSFPEYAGQKYAFQNFVQAARDKHLPIGELASKFLASGACEVLRSSDLLGADPFQSSALLPPLIPEQVWAAAFTYPPKFGWNMYAEERSAKRPILFFKGTGSHCVGPNDRIGVRKDSSHTIPEPELALILDEQGRTLGYTIANDVTALDFTNKSPLYISYSKTYRNSVALGPVIATPDEIPDPNNLKMKITITRDGSQVAGGEASTSELIKSFEDLICHTVEHNALSLGTVLCTGGGVWLPFDFTLKPADVVEIEVENIGILRNVAEEV
ncbi:MAG: fumarylacetoacetate hydrolase family protein [Acidobacteria bacterium]|nr:fumarylacetoacetate hydrolase family protein [Acidobacteriota bacterium]